MQSFGQEHIHVSEFAPQLATPWRSKFDSVPTARWNTSYLREDPDYPTALEELDTDMFQDEFAESIAASGWKSVSDAMERLRC